MILFILTNAGPDGVLILYEKNKKQQQQQHQQQQQKDKKTGLCWPLPIPRHWSFLFHRAPFRELS